MRNGRRARGMSRTVGFFVPLAVVGTIIAAAQGWTVAQAALRHHFSPPVQEMVALQGRLEQLTSQLQERAASTARLQVEADRLTQSLRALDTHNVALQSMVERTETEAAQLRRSLAQALSDLEQLHDARQLLVEKRRLQHALANLAQLIKDLTRQLGQADERQRRLESQLADAKRAAQSRVNALKTAVGNNQAKRQEMAAQLDERAGQLEQERQRTQRLQDALVRLADALKGKQGEVDQLRGVEQTIREQEAALTGAKAQAQATQARLEGQLHDMQAQIEQAVQAKTTVQQQLDALTQRATAAEHESGRRADQVLKLQEAQQQAQQARDALEAQVQYLQGAAQQGQDRIASLQARIDQLDQSLKDKTLAVAHAQDQYAALQASHEQLQKDLAGARAIQQQAAAQLAQARDAQRSFQERLNGLVSVLNVNAAGSPSAERQAQQQAEALETGRHVQQLLGIHEPMAPTEPAPEAHAAQPAAPAQE